MSNKTKALGGFLSRRFTYKLIWKAVREERKYNVSPFSVWEACGH